jgi:hypothetical protein
MCREHAVTDTDRAGGTVLEPPDQSCLATRRGGSPMAALKTWIKSVLMKASTVV